MTAHDLAVLVLCYGLGYSLMRHCSIGVALGGLVVVGFFVQQRHGDESAILTAYSLGVVACWVLKQRWLSVGGYRWRLHRLFSDFSTWRFRASRKSTEDLNRETEGIADDEDRGYQESADYRRRAEQAQEQRAEEARRRRQQDDARKGRRGAGGNHQEQAHTEERPKQKQHRKQQEQSDQRRQEEAPSGQQKEQSKATTESPMDTRTPEEVLGVQPGYSLEQLKHAYRQQCQRLHPDRWQDRPPHIRVMLEEEQKKVNVAFQTLEKPFK